MKKSNLALFLFVAFILGACTNSPETPFSEYGISFTTPAGWKVDEVEELEDRYCVSVEKEGLTNKALAMIQVFFDEANLDGYPEAYLQALEEGGITSDIKAEEKKPYTYGSYEGEVINYTSTVLEVPYQGKIILFKTEGKGVCILTYEAVKSESENIEDFKTIENSLHIESFQPVED